MSYEIRQFIGSVALVGILLLWAFNQTEILVLISFVTLPLFAFFIVVEEAKEKEARAARFAALSVEEKIEWYKSAAVNASTYQQANYYSNMAQTLIQDEIRKNV